MCLCCCVTRKSVLIYLIVISVFAFIYGIVAISKFGSSTDIYKTLVEKLKQLEQENQSSTSSSSKSTNDFYNDFKDYYNSNSNSNYNNYKNYYNYDDEYSVLNGNIYNSKVVKAVLDSASYAKIQQLTPNDLAGNSYKLIMSLKDIENGLGTILFIFPIIFLIIEIVFLVTICGTKEFQVLSDSSFQIFSIIRIICLSISITFIFLSLLYSILLISVLSQYLELVEIYDSCGIGIVIGMVYGFYGLCYYINLARAFHIERILFLKVGSESNPGPDAQYRSNGEPISCNQGNNYNPNQELSNPSIVQVYNNNEAKFYKHNQQSPNPSAYQVYNNNEANFYNQNQQLKNSSRVQVNNNKAANIYNRNQQLLNPSTVEIYNNKDVKTDEKFLYSHGVEPEEYITVKGVLYKRVDKQNNNFINKNNNVDNNNYNQERTRGRIGRNNYRNNNNGMRYQRRINNRNQKDYDKKSQNSKTEII